MGAPETQPSTSTAKPTKGSRRRLVKVAATEPITTNSPPVTPGKKRKPIDLTQDSPTATQQPPTKKAKKTPAPKQPVGEIRQRRFRYQPPQSYNEILSRARSQRMFVIERTSTGTTDHPEQTIEIAGTTGNLYEVKVNKVPSCTCPHARKGNQCKHIVYVLHFVLKAPTNLQYQLAFLTSELEQIFAGAPKLDTSPTKSYDSSDPKRKPVDDEECPICCVPFDPTTEKIVYCKAACGNNLHKGCFEQWAVQKKASGCSQVTCPFCRTPWQGDDDVQSKVDKVNAKKGQDGYLNVAQQLGLSGMRDYSSYHQPWVNTRTRAGHMDDEEY